MIYEPQEGQYSGNSFVRLCWLRESAPGHLEYDGGTPVAKPDLLLALFGVHPSQPRITAEPPVALPLILDMLSGKLSVDLLPQWARRRLAIGIGPLLTPEHRIAAAANAQVLASVADRILSIAGNEPNLEVHLPYIDRRTWSSRFDILDKTEFIQLAGRIVPADLCTVAEQELYNGRLLAAASAQPGIATKLRFMWSQTLASGLAVVMLPVDGIALESIRTPLARVDIEMTLPTSVCRVWNRAPAEDSMDYFETHAPMSVAVQSAMRRWLAWTWLTDLENFEDKRIASIVLAYVATRPFPGRRRTDFTYDPLSDKWMHYAFRCARSPLLDMLKAVHRNLKSAGKDRLAKYYHPSRVKVILEKSHEEQKSIRALIAAEGVIINHILKLGNDLRGASDAMLVTHQAPDFIWDLGTRLRRFFHCRDLTGLGSMLLIVATEALSTALGGQPAVATRIEAWPADVNERPAEALIPVPESPSRVSA